MAPGSPFLEEFKDAGMQLPETAGNCTDAGFLSRSMHQKLQCK